MLDRSAHEVRDLHLADQRFDASHRVWVEPVSELFHSHVALDRLPAHAGGRIQLRNVRQRAPKSNCGY